MDDVHTDVKWELPVRKCEYQRANAVYSQQKGTVKGGRRVSKPAPPITKSDSSSQHEEAGAGAQSTPSCSITHTHTTARSAGGMLQGGVDEYWCVKKSRDHHPIYYRLTDRVPIYRKKPWNPVLRCDLPPAAGFKKKRIILF